MSSRRLQEGSRFRSELDSIRGSVAIIVIAAVLPFLFFLFSLSLDVAVYYTDQAKAQAALDETTQYAFRFLPDINGAKSAAESYAARFKGLSGVEFEVTDSTIVGTLNRSSPLIFAQLVGMQDAKLPLRVISRARGTPVDAFLVLDTTSSVAPNLMGGSDAAWGGLLDWPAAQGINPIGGIDPRLQTQQCFNPTFSNLKSGAQLAYQLIGASKANSLGLGFYTGDGNNPLFPARNVMSLPTLPATAAPEVQFVGYSAPYVGPSVCARIAEQEHFALHYRFPDRPRALPARGDITNRPLSRLTAGATGLDPAYAPYLTGEELLWVQPASGMAPRAFSHAFVQSLGSLLSGERSAVRGGLQARTEKMLVWFGAHLPQESNLEWSNSGEAPADLRLAMSDVFSAPGVADAINNGGGALTILFIFAEPPNAPGSIVPQALQNLTALISGVGADAGIDPKALRVRAFTFGDTGRVSTELTRLLASLNRTTVVAL